MLPPIITDRRTKFLTLFGGLILLSNYFSIAQTSVHPCDLLQPAELESALGGKASNFSNQTLNTSQICNGKVGKFNIVIRVADRAPENGPSKEQKGAEMLKSQGWQINIKTDKELTTSTAIPPASSSQYGYNTTASIFKNGKVVAVEATAENQKDMASTETLVSLVRKAYERLPK